MTMFLAIFCFTTPANACTNPPGAAGDVVFNSTSKVMQYCDTNNWKSMGLRVAEEPSISGGNGYFVLIGNGPANSEANEFDGNLGGLSGADATCLSYLQTYNWLGKTSAQARGLLTASNVKAWLCDDSSCQDMLPSTQYAFATTQITKSGVGGYTFTTDANGFYPTGNSQIWSDATTFDRNTWLHTGRSPTNTPSTGQTCNNWSDSSSADDSMHGYSNTTNDDRWSDTHYTCDERDQYVCMVNPNPPSSDGIVTGGLIGHWRLDETVGTTVYDSVGGNNGTMQGGMTGAADTVPGRVGTALDFDGVDDEVDIPNNAAYNLAASPATFAVWAKADPVQPDPFVRIFQRFAGSPNRGYKLQFSNGQVLFLYGNGGAGDPINFTTTATYLDGQWHHYTVTLDGTGTAKFYVDGTLLLTDSYSGLDDIPGEMTRLASTGSGARLKGAVDDFRIYNRELTPAEVQEIYSARDFNLRYNTNTRAPEYFYSHEWISAGPIKPTRTGLVGHWKLDEASGTFADSSGYGNTGTQSGGVTYASSGIINTAAGFDGVNDYIDFGDQQELDFGSTSSFTISLWQKSTQTGNATLLQKKSSGSAAASGYGLRYRQPIAKLQWLISDGTDQAELQANYSDVNDGLWHHIVVVVDRASTSQALYIDNVLKASGSIAGVDNVDTAFGLVLGAESGINLLNGLLDDARIYNRALSAEEIAGLYASGDGYNERDGLVSHWKLDETGGTVIADSVGGQNGAYSGGTVVSGGGRIGNAFDFAANDEEIDAGSADMFDIQTGSVSFWFNTPNATSSAPRYFFAKDNSGQNDGDLSLQILSSSHGSANKIALVNEETGTTYTVISDNVAPSGVWVFVTVNFGVGGMEMYIDGILQGDTNAFDLGMTNVSADVIIGNLRPGNGNDFDGLIDDVRIYNRRLSAEEVQNLYFWGLANGPACTNPAREEGTIIFNTNHNVLQYCDGVNWRGMGP